MFKNSLCCSSPSEIERCINEVKNLETKVSDLQDAFTLFMIHGDEFWKKNRNAHKAKIIDINEGSRKD